MHRLPCRGSTESRLQIPVNDFQTSVHGESLACIDCHTALEDEQHTTIRKRAESIAGNVMTRLTGTDYSATAIIVPSAIIVIQNTASSLQTTNSRRFSPQILSDLPHLPSCSMRPNKRPILAAFTEGRIAQQTGLQSIVQRNNCIGCHAECGRPWRQGVTQRPGVLRLSRAPWRGPPAGWLHACQRPADGPPTGELYCRDTVCSGAGAARTRRHSLLVLSSNDREES